MPANSPAKKAKPNEIHLARVYDAPVALVWDAWTDPAKAAEWWGPRGFTITTHSKDLRVGGHWAYTMHGPDGTDYPNKTLYYEIEPQRKLVYDHGGSDDRPPLFRVTVLFEEIARRTHMDMTMSFASPEVARDMAKFIKQAGGNGTWDRLAEYLEDQSTGRQTFVINRTFPAPRGVLFEMWTQPEQLSRWLPPAGFDMKFAEADIQTGGRAAFSMRNAVGMEMHGRCDYREISPPVRIVYTQQFTDAAGNVSRHPGAPLWPETMLTTVLFEEEDPDSTRVTVTSEPYGKTTPEEVAAFVQERPGMSQGWTGSFDKLEELLTTPTI